VPIAYPRVTTRHHAVVRAFRALARRPRGETRVLLAGARVIDEALRMRVRLRTLLVTRDFLTEASPADRAVVSGATRAGAAVYEGSPAVLEAASPVHTASGIVAIAEWSPVAITDTFAPPPALAIGLVDVQDPGNVGAVIRSADALGATGVVTIGDSADPGSWKALRGAMGSTFRLPVARAPLEEVVAAARRLGLIVIAAVPDAATPLEGLDLSTRALLLLGNEGAGLAGSAVGQADERVTVPMRRGVNSLNVAVTAALILYEARRQRGVSESPPVK
jgi:TrmH family RNA methyltransferase